MQVDRIGKLDRKRLLKGALRKYLANGV